MSTLMILQCTNKKTPSGQPMPVHDFFAESLGPTRNQLIAHYPQPNYDNGQLLPAYERYRAGQLYQKISLATVQEKINLGSLRVIIVSALFGALEFDTPIRNYDLVMSKTKRKWLARNVLGNAIQRYVLARPDITHIKSFVSTTDYLPAMGQFVPAGVEYLGNDWIPYSRGSQVATKHVVPFLNGL